MTANVTVQAARSAGALRVPNAALRFRPTTEQLAALGATRRTTTTLATGQGPMAGTVWRATGTTIERVSVRTGLTDGVVTEITGGALKVDDQVATAFAGGTTGTTTALSSSPTRSR